MKGAAQASVEPLELTPEASLTPRQLARRKRIIAAALELASRGGYDAVQMRDVAASADVALGTLYRYFPSKDFLLAHTWADWSHEIEGYLHRHPLRGNTAADRILICIHGIIGDTRGIAAGVLAANPKELVLTFDYENINTTIEENAQLLKDRLAAAGLVAGHGKTVQIAAHSMGGLISRWFIEQLEGGGVVQSLVGIGPALHGGPGGGNRAEGPPLSC